jgi:hypothetical protein
MPGDPNSPAVPGHLAAPRLAAPRRADEAEDKPEKKSMIILGYVALPVPLEADHAGDAVHHPAVVGGLLVQQHQVLGPDPGS